MKKSTRKLISSKAGRVSPLAAALLIILMVTIWGSVAYIFMSTPPVENTFTPATITPPDIPETFDEEEKKNVTVKVNADFDCYVRAMVVITLQDDDGNTVAKTPVEGTDYTISLGSDWQYEAPYYYYKGVVPANGTTTNLINSCKSLNTEYHLVVDVLSQTIQADGVITSGDNAGTAGTPAVEHAWGMSYSNGTWSAAGN